jgi:peptidoglycan/LPS O-acetylase OafA/YrhL
MPELLATLVGTAAAFLAGGAYYAALGDRLDDRDAEMPPWKLAVEVARCLILAAVVAGLATEAEIDTWTQGLLLGLALWVGFPLVLWIGAVIHENAPVKLAAIHGGDWLVKLLLVGGLVAALS